MIPWSMLPDVIELAELNTGDRNEGIFYSMFAFFQKVGVGVGLALSSYSLGWAGYVKPETDEEDLITHQTDAVLWVLRILIGPIPAILLALSMVCIIFYPITRARYDEIHMALEQKRKERKEQKGRPKSYD